MHVPGEVEVPEDRPSSIVTSRVLVSLLVSLEGDSTFPAHHPGQVHDPRTPPVVRIEPKVPDHVEQPIKFASCGHAGSS